MVREFFGDGVRWGGGGGVRLVLPFGDAPLIGRQTRSIINGLEE